MVNDRDDQAMSRPLDRIRVRDPFVLVERDEQRYWLYGTTDPDPWHGPGVGFDAWWSRDLENWHGPIAVFRPPPGFWGECNFWAPEIHLHRGRLVMFASFHSAREGRGVQTLVADHPSGPFLPLSTGPVTPPGWACSLLLRGCRARQMGDRRQSASRMVWESQPKRVTVL
jgi:arabinan endo-1,5-alpha-L-arabinosidase